MYRLKLLADVQVYGIIASQLVLTAMVAGVILALPSVRSFVMSSLAFQATFAVLPLIGERHRLCHLAETSPLSRQLHILGLSSLLLH